MVNTDTFPGLRNLLVVFPGFQPIALYQDLYFTPGLFLNHDLLGVPNWLWFLLNCCLKLAPISSSSVADIVSASSRFPTNVCCPFCYLFCVLSTYSFASKCLELCLLESSFSLWELLWPLMSPEVPMVMGCRRKIAQLPSTELEQSLRDNLHRYGIKLQLGLCLKFHLGFNFFPALFPPLSIKFPGFSFLIYHLHINLCLDSAFLQKKQSFYAATVCKKVTLFMSGWGLRPGSEAWHRSQSLDSLAHRATACK